MAAARRRRKSRRWLTTLVVLVIAVLIVSYRLVEKVGHERKPADRFTVRKVIDGDTVELTGGDRLRLLAIDTPEKREPFHDEALGLLARLTRERPLRIEYDRQRRDRYGRMLGFAFVDDTLFVNRMLVDSGLAYVYLFKDDNLQRDEYRQLLAAQRRAIERKVGLWSVRREREKEYLATEGSFRLHRPGCADIRKLREGHYRTFASREEGLAEGLSPCRNCKP
ncbi:MAG: thermonuclease family protein [Candidatus Zixiibacteriota bacterium]